MLQKLRSAIRDASGQRYGVEFIPTDTGRRAAAHCFSRILAWRATTTRAVKISHPAIPASLVLISEQN